MIKAADDATGERGKVGHFFHEVASAKNVKPPDIATGTGITQPRVTRVTLQFDQKSLMHHEEA